MGVVDGSIHWNGQDNFIDFIQFAADKVGMTREEYIAHYGFHPVMNEADKKPGPDPYHRGLDDEEVEDKEDQIKKQADMDDDDPDAYKEMPGDKEAREKGEVKTSKATKSYNKLYGEDLDEGTMSDIHQMAGEVKSEEEFIKRFFKEYGAKIKKTKDSEEWAKSLYNDMNESKQIGEANEQQDQMAFAQLERIIDYATMLRDRMAAGKGLDAWMYGKIVKAEDYLNTLYDVVDGDDGVVETQKMTNKDWKKIKKFNKHVTDSGEKFVMSYDDRIGTFLEPVEIVDEKEVSEAFKFGKKNQYSIDDVNEAYGFWGTLEAGGFKVKEIEDCWYSAMAWLTEAYKFSDAGALYYLNAKAGRWVADQVIENKGHKDVVDVLEDYATPNEWKKWSKEYNKFAQEEMMQEAVNEEKAEGDRGPIGDDAIETALKKKADETGVPIGIIRVVMRRGMAAWKSGHRPGANQQQWGYARVNAFLTKGEGTWGGADSDLAKEVRDGGHDKKLKKG